MNPPANGSGLEIIQSNEDLINTKGRKEKRNWIIAGGVGLVVFILIIVIIVTFNKSSDGKVILGKLSYPAISLEDLLTGKLNARGFNASWISDDELLYRDINGNLVKHNVQKRSTEIVLPMGHAALTNSFEYTTSSDGKFLLIAHDYQKVYRYSYIAQYTILNLETKAIRRINLGNDVLLQYVRWGPVDNALIIISRFNIYYKAAVEGNEIVTLTKDGQLGVIYNGVPDWVYEEEVFSSNNALWFSKDGSKLAYAKFNDSGVPVMGIPVYGKPGSLEFQYPRGVQIRYPKPGTRNPIVSLHVVDLKDGFKQKVVDIPEGLRDPILSTASWANEETLFAIWMNRVQNEAKLTYYRFSSQFQPEIIKSLSEPNGWLDLFTQPKFSKNGSNFIIILPQHQNDAVGAFKHISLFGGKEISNVEALTQGNYVVTEILEWDEHTNNIYFQATTEDPAVQHLYSLNLDTKSKKCLSCDIKSEQGLGCLFNSATFSTNNSHYILDCSGPGVPELSVFSTKSDIKLFTWDDNEELVEFIREKPIPKNKRLQFSVGKDFKAQVLLRLPPNIDTSGSVKYPMLVHVYGGPDSNQVFEKFSLDWGSYLASNKSIIYALIDARGSGLKGERMMFSIYKKLGSYEVYDQINVTRQIQKALSYVDASRTAIWGWSYGGYAAGMALANNNDVFKCGISVAPVTDWALYDSIYTERYMGVPSENPIGYKNAELLNKAEGLRNKLYYLIHGTLDDNVHFQQSMMWSKVLEENDIQFQQQVYPDEDHGLASVRSHLYHSLENFLDDCFISNKN